MKSTESLLNELMSAKKIGTYIKKNEKIFEEHNILAENFWKEACEKSHMSKSHIISASNFSYCYFYDVINGRKVPTSDKIIKLVLTMKMSLEECQTALTFSGKAKLYPDIKRDSIIIYSILHKLSANQCSELLEKYDEPILK